MAEREEMQNHQNPNFGFFDEYEHFLEISRNLEEIFSSKNIEETNPLENKIDEEKIQEKSNFSYMRGLYTYLCLVFTDNIIRWIIMVFFSSNSNPTAWRWNCCATSCASKPRRSSRLLKMTSRAFYRYVLYRYFL